MMTSTNSCTIDTVLGELTLVARGGALIGLYFPGHWYRPDESTFGRRVEPDEDPVLAAASAELGEFLAGGRQSFDVAVASTGDEFSQRVWALLTEIPFGETTTYGTIAAELGDRTLAQRVGQAVGHNPVSIIVPCHRVLGAGGALTGYAGGLRRKRWLLELEGALDAPLFDDPDLTFDGAGASTG